MSAIEKLFRIQSTLKVPKKRYNEFGEFYYRNAEDILESLKKILKTERAVILVTDDVVAVGDRVYICANAVLVDIDDMSKIEVKAYAREDVSKKKMDGSQMTGASSSYAKKYALCGLLGIDDGKDNDSLKPESTKTGKTVEQSIGKLICEECKNEIISFSDTAGKIHQAKDIVDLSKEIFGKVMCHKCYIKAKSNR